MCVESQAGGVTHEQETSLVYLPRTRSGRVSLKTSARCRVLLGTRNRRSGRVSEHVRSSAICAGTDC